jgi:hypothetical protein
MRKRRSVFGMALLAMVWLLFLTANASSAGTVNLPKTGQTTCYDAVGNVIPCPGTGQDGEIRAGVAWPDPRFTDNGDGTVTDNLTGLMWLKDANCFGSMTWQGALNKVADLNANPGSYTCGGYSATYTDWTLPNVNELESLYNAEQPNSASWLNGKGFVNVQSDNYWSSTTNASYIGHGWVVGMKYGSVNRLVKSENYYVWPVRSITTPPAALWRTGQTASYAVGDDGDLQRGVAWPAPRFADNGDGTVTDNLTGLMWLKDANCFGNMTWQAALDKVADFNANPTSFSCGGYAAAYSDWRLPNRKELHSLSDFSQFHPALPEGHPYSDVQADSFYWSSTTRGDYTSGTFAVYMPNGNVLVCPKSYDDRCVWPVRSQKTGPPVTPDIKANGSDAPIRITLETPLSVTVGLDPGDYAGFNADWWIAVHTPFAAPGNWYTYVHPTGWKTGVNLCAQAALFDLAPFEVLEMVLPVGNYTFYFAVDPPDGIPTAELMDSVEVQVE